MGIEFVAAAAAVEMERLGVSAETAEAVFVVASPTGVVFTGELEGAKDRPANKSPPPLLVSDIL